MSEEREEREPWKGMKYLRGVQAVFFLIRRFQEDLKNT